MILFILVQPAETPGFDRLNVSPLDVVLGAQETVPSQLQTVIISQEIVGSNPTVQGHQAEDVAERPKAIGSPSPTQVSRTTRKFVPASCRRRSDVVG